MQPSSDARNTTTGAIASDLIHGMPNGDFAMSFFLARFSQFIFLLAESSVAETRST